MLEKFVDKLAKYAFPGRDVSYVKIKGKGVLVFHTITCNDYKLEGTYTYSQVERINQLTTYSSGYGYCKGIGPVAFIGIPNEKSANVEQGDFEYKVDTYGSPTDTEIECVEKYVAYPKDVAKKIANYTVYGLMGLEEVAKEAPIDEISYFLDSRYTAKKFGNPPRVFCMDVKVRGTYNYTDAKILATGTEEKEWFSGEDRPIVFGELESGEHVGLIDVWPYEATSGKVLGFRDVWQYNHQKPDVEKIRFLTTEEAKTYDDYSLYVYRYHSSGVKNRDKYDIEKYDRTLDKHFNFHLKDGSDYRLIPHKPC